MTGNCNGNSPLVWDEVMLGAMRAFCKRNQPVLCSPFVLGGANTPASTAASVAQLNAEALSALAYTQVVNKGCPGDLWPLPVDSFDEVRRPDGGHA